MKTHQTIYVLLLFSIFLFENCKKYPDGPWISFRKPKTRLTHSWNVSSFKINGAEAMNRIAITVSGTITPYNIPYTNKATIISNTFVFNKNGAFTTALVDSVSYIDSHYSFALGQPYYDVFHDNTVDTGTWALINDDKKLQLTNPYVSGTYIQTYDILELKEKTIILSGLTEFGPTVITLIR